MAKIIGLKRGIVKLEEHNPDWVKVFEKEKNILLENFSDVILETIHGGSTAIPGMPAKPIIDIFAAVSNLNDIKDSRIVEKLENLGYKYHGEDGVKGRILYTKTKNEISTYHLHFVKKNGSEWSNSILVKEYFIKNPGMAEKYAKLKIKLAEKYPNNRKAYTHGKDAFLKSIIKNN